MLMVVMLTIGVISCKKEELDPTKTHVKAVAFKYPMQGVNVLLHYPLVKTRYPSTLGPSMQIGNGTVELILEKESTILIQNLEDIFIEVNLTFNTGTHPLVYDFVLSPIEIKEVIIP